MQAYAITRFISRLVSAPWYFRAAVLVLAATVLTVVLIHQFVSHLWGVSSQLDQNYDELNAQLLRYQVDRDRINHDYNQLMHSSRQFAKLQRQFSRAKSEEIEIWLIQTAVHHQLEPNEVQVSTQLHDELGEFFSISCKLSGLVISHQRFLENLISSDYFLIWEKLSFAMDDSGQMKLTLTLKQYVQIRESKNVTG